MSQVGHVTVSLRDLHTAKCSQSSCGYLNPLFVCVTVNTQWPGLPCICYSNEIQWTISMRVICRIHSRIYTIPSQVHSTPPIYVVYGWECCGPIQHGRRWLLQRWSHLASGSPPCSDNRFTLLRCCGSCPYNYITCAINFNPFSSGMYTRPLR